MDESEALLAIQELMDGVEWSPTTLESIADIMRNTGYSINGLDEIIMEAPSA